MEEVSDGVGEATVGRGGQRERHCSLVWLGTAKMYEDRGPHGKEDCDLQ